MGKMKYLLAAFLLSVSAVCWAENPPNPCGNHGNNCQPGDEGGGTGGGNSNADATANAAAGAVSVSGAAAITDVRNTNLNSNSNLSWNSNKAFGGTGIGVGGEGGRGGAGGEGGNALAVGEGGRGGAGGLATANSSNDNRSSAAGNSTSVNVAGDVYEAKRNAPSISGGMTFPTASCKGSFGIGGSGINGSGLINFSTTDKECQTILLGDHFATIGMPNVACELFKTTKAWERAKAKNPNLDAVCR